jgi:hypothetical protein
VIASGGRSPDHCREFEVSLAAFLATKSKSGHRSVGDIKNPLDGPLERAQAGIRPKLLNRTGRRRHLSRPHPPKTNFDMCSLLSFVIVYERTTYEICRPIQTRPLLRRANFASRGGGGAAAFFRHLANSPKCQVFFSVPVLVCQWKITLLGPLPPHRVKTLDGLQGTFYLNCRCKEPHTSIQQFFR